MNDTNTSANVIDLDTDELLETRVAAKLMRCSLATLYRWMERGQLPWVKRVGRRWIRRVDLEALLVPGEPRRRPEPVEVPRRVAEKTTMETLRAHGYV
jgi:excisionase family DNA binding protein